MTPGSGGSSGRRRRRRCSFAKITKLYLDLIQKQCRFIERLRQLLFIFNQNLTIRFLHHQPNNNKIFQKIKKSLKICYDYLKFFSEMIQLP